jgi:hypothetical protein
METDHPDVKINNEGFTYSYHEAELKSGLQKFIRRNLAEDAVVCALALFLVRQSLRRKKELMEMRMSLVNEVAGIIRGRVSKGKTLDQDRFYTVPITSVVKMLLETRPGAYIFNFANWPSSGCDC